MKEIMVDSLDARLIERAAEKNGTTVVEIVTILCDHLNEIMAQNDMKGVG